jgi:hypothetical protein
LWFESADGGKPRLNLTVAADDVRAMGLMAAKFHEKVRRLHRQQQRPLLDLLACSDVDRDHPRIVERCYYDAVGYDEPLGLEEEKAANRVVKNE